MGRKTWTQDEVNALTRRIGDKVRQGEKLTAGEDTVWGVMRGHQPLPIRLVEEIDFMMGFEADDMTDG